VSRQEAGRQYRQAGICGSKAAGRQALNLMRCNPNRIHAAGRQQAGTHPERQAAGTDPETAESRNHIIRVYGRTAVQAARTQLNGRRWRRQAGGDPEKSRTGRPRAAGEIHPPRTQAGIEDPGNAGRQAGNGRKSMQKRRNGRQAEQEETVYNGRQQVSRQAGTQYGGSETAAGRR